MAYDGWLEFNGSELINLSRTVQLAEALGIDTVWVDPESVAWIQAALSGVDYDLITNAPWYDAGYPASAEFAGIIPLSMAGFDNSTLEATTIEYITDGGSSGKPRNKTLSIVASVAVVASTDRGADFGKRWLDRMLRAGGAQTFCSGSDLRYFRFAQAEGEPVPPQAHRRDVTLTRGTSVTRKRGTYCSATWLATYTWTANDPFEYGDEVEQFSGLGGVALNLVTNSGFEASITGWASFGSASLFRSTDESHSGVASGQVTASGVGGAFLNPFAPIGATRDFALSLWVLGAVDAEIEIGIAENPGGTQFALTPVTMTGDWQRVTLAGTASGAATDVSPQINVTGTDVIFFDDVMFVEGLTPYEIGDGTVAGPSVISSGSVALVEQECPVYDYSPIYDPLYPALVAPPSVPDFYPQGWDLVSGQTFDRFWVRVDSTEPSVLNVVPVLTLTTEEDARMVRVSIWPSDSVPDDQCDPLWVAIITYLPAGMDFVIDGEQEASYVEGGVTLRRTDSLVYGTGARPIEWAAFNDPTDLLITIDILSGSGSVDYDGGGTVRAALSFVPKSD